MSPSPVDILTESGTHDSVDDGGGDDSSEALEHQALEPASEAFVKNHTRRVIRHHVAFCPIRRLRWWLVFAAGGLFVGQVAAVVIIKLGMTAAQVELQKTVETTVEKMLKEKKILGTETPVQAPVLVTTTNKGGPS